MPFTATKNGKTFDELELEINRLKFHQVWRVIMPRLYPNSRIRNNTLSGQTGQVFYRGLIPFQLISGEEVFDTKLAFDDVLDELEAWKIEQVSELNVEFEELQRQHDLRQRIRSLKHLLQAKRNLNLFPNTNNSALIEKQIIDNNMEAELVLLEAEDIAIENEVLFQDDVDEVGLRMIVGNRIVATINKMNRDNNITISQVQAILADPEVQTILQLLQTGALESSKTLIEAKDLSSLPPMDQSYKDRVIAMIDRYLGI